MKRKTIISLIAFAAAFTFSTALAGLTFDSATGENIALFLQQDIQNGQERTSKSYRFENDYDSYISKRAKAVSEYTNESAAMDESRFPQDFQIVWLKHMRAWHNYADFLQNQKNKMTRGENNRLENQYIREVNRTWWEVLRMAKKYGADIPPEAYKAS